MGQVLKYLKKQYKKTLKNTYSIFISHSLDSVSLIRASFKFLSLGEVFNLEYG